MINYDAIFQPAVGSGLTLDVGREDLERSQTKQIRTHKQPVTPVTSPLLPGAASFPVGQFGRTATAKLQHLEVDPTPIE